MPPKPDTWWDHVERAVQGLTRQALTAGCRCTPQVDRMPSVKNDNNVELVLVHEPHCPAYRED